MCGLSSTNKIMQFLFFKGTKKRQNQSYMKKILESKKCLINHTDSTGSMEAASLVDCFMSSVETRNLRYAHSIGGQSLLRYC